MRDAAGEVLGLPRHQGTQWAALPAEIAIASPADGGNHLLEAAQKPLARLSPAQQNLMQGIWIIMWLCTYLKLGLFVISVRLTQ